MINTACKPNFVGIGGERCGSTWLWTQLRNHPNVYLAPLKELQFFSRLLWRNTELAHLEKLMMLRDEEWLDVEANTIEHLLQMSLIELKMHFGGSAEYVNIFSKASHQQISGDISPQYACLERSQIELMAQLNPEMKIIFVIRHPVDRLISCARLKSVEFGVTCDDTFIKNVMSWPAQIRQSQYSITYNLFVEKFPAVNILVLPFELIAENPSKFMREISKFLGIHFDVNYFPKLSEVINQSINRKNENLIDLKSMNISVYEEQYDFADLNHPGLGDRWRTRTQAMQNGARDVW